MQRTRIIKKGKGAYSSSWNSPQNYGTPLVNGITQCYLPPDRGDRIHPNRAGWYSIYRPRKDERLSWPSWASYSSDLPLDNCIWDILQDLVYEGRRLPFASLHDLKEAVKKKWKKVTIEIVRKSTTQWKNDWMRLESRMEARFSTFSANRCDWISNRSHAVRRVEIIGYFA